MTKALSRRKASASSKNRSTALAIRKKRKPSTSLAIRKHALPAPVFVNPTALAVDPHTLGDDTEIGALGLVEIKLTEAEELILNLPVDIDAVQIKPTGQPYLSHPGYTRWFNRAFGRLGWAMVPAAKPTITTRPDGQGQTIVCPYVLHIHGKPAAYALGEQEYHEKNKEQTYGDAFEATVASALRRCAKRMGVGLELWDKSWLNRFVAEHCVKVWCGEDRKPSWRRRTDPPFWNEQGARQQQPLEQPPATHYQPRQESRPPAGNAPPPAHRDAANDDRPISDIPRSKANPNAKVGQVQRLWIITKKSGRDPVDIKRWLKARYGYTSSKEIKRKHYEAICEAIASPDDLPILERQVGEEG